jgi:hypothetical protein
MAEDVGRPFAQAGRGREGVAALYVALYAVVFPLNVLDVVVVVMIVVVIVLVFAVPSSCPGTHA